MATYDRVRELPLEIESYRLEGLRGAGVARLHAPDDRDPPRGRRPRGGRRGRDLLERRPDGAPGRGPDAPARRQPHARQLLAAPRAPGALPLGPGMAALRRLPALGLRERGARPRASAGGPLAGRGRRPRGAAGRPSSSPCESSSRPPPTRCRSCSSATRRSASSSTRRANGTRRWSASSARPARSTPSTSRAPTRALPVDQPGDPALYRMVAEGFPTAWIEDPDLTEETDPVLEPASRPDHLGRADPLGRRHHRARRSRRRPSTSSRRASAASSASSTATTTAPSSGIAIYGGGQWELGPGRGQIQHLASLFHPSTPNDVAPAAFNIHRLDPPPGLPDEPARACSRAPPASAGATRS